jgi:hypothetical protein
MGSGGMILRATYLLDECITGNSECRAPLMAWRYEVEEAHWSTAEDLLSSNLMARTDETANSFVFIVVPRLCFVRTSVRFAKGVVLVTQAWVGGGAVAVNRLAA